MKISLRYKIQFAVVLILFVTLASYIGLASQTLLKEKTASLMETTSADAEVAASRIGRKLTAQEFWVEGMLSKDGLERQNQMAQDANLLAVVRTTLGITERVFSRDDMFKEMKPPPSQTKGLGFFPLPGEGRFWLTKVFSNGDSISSLWSQELFADEQKNYSDGALFLINTSNQEGLALGQDLHNITAVTAELSRESFPQMLTSKWLELKSGKYVLSSCPVEFFPLVAVVIYPESIILEAVRALQVQSLYFALFAIGLTGLFSFWIGRALTQKLVLLSDETVKIAQGDLESARLIRTNDEIGDLSSSIVTMASDLKKYIGAVAESARMESELKTAKTVQDMLFPELSWGGEKFEIRGYYESASECGGDLWFYWKTGNDLFFLIADATGHGAPAALITSAARSTIAGVQYTNETSVTQIAELLNYSIMQASKGAILMTAWLGKLNLESGDVEYLNCSHEPAFILKPDGTYQSILGMIHPRLGDQHVKSEKYRSEKFKLEAGEKLYLYTDGVSDIESQDGSRYSDRRFAKLLITSFRPPRTLEESLFSLVKTLKDFSGHSPLADDMTMLVVEMKS